MRLLVGAFLLALAGLQYRLWLSDDGVREIWRLRDSVSHQQADNRAASERNAQLKAEVRDLKEGFSAVEERARSDLGMIKSNETFYQVVPRDPDSPALTQPTTASARSQ